MSEGPEPTGLRPGVARLPSRSRVPAVLRTPPEGWSSLVALLVMLGVTGLAVDDVRLVGITLTGGSQTEALPLLIVLAGVVGTLLARSSIGIVRAHLIGAAAGAIVILVAVAATVSPSDDLLVRLRDLQVTLSTYVGDAAVGRPTRGVAALLLAIGAIFWTTGQFAAFGVFRFGRAGPPIVASGTLLLVAMGIAQRLQLEALAVFCAAAMVLVMRLNLSRQQQGWSRRHIADVREVSRLFMRTGLAFAAVALACAVGLATVATGAPLSNAWAGIDDAILDITHRWPQIAGGIGITPPRPNNVFGPVQPISGFWEDSDAPMFVATVDDGAAHYWRGSTYNDFTGWAWSQALPQSYEVDAGDTLLAQSSDLSDLSAGTRHEVRAEVISTGLAGPTLLSPAAPDVAPDRSTRVQTSDRDGPLLTIDMDQPIVPGGRFALTARVPVFFEKGGSQKAITGNELAAAGVDYPPQVILAGYTTVQDGSTGEKTDKALRDVLGRMDAGERDNPYRVAVAVQRYFVEGDRFTYATDVRKDCSADTPVPECLLSTGRGYCQHFATTMIVMLRKLDIPARFVQGYLPGTRTGDDSWQVDRGSLHAWVEVYFPEYGWIQFDPTPGQEERGAGPTSIDDGPRLPEGTPGPDEGTDRDPTDPASPSEEPSPSPLPVDAVPPGGGLGGPDLQALLLLAAAGAVLALLGAGLALAVRLRRLPAPESDLAYRGVVSLASRMGHPPRPTQTAYEYVASLAEVVPQVRDDLALVAHARVRSAYARRLADGEALAALRAAYRRVRVALVRLALPFRGGPRRPPGPPPASGPRALAGPPPDSALPPDPGAPPV